MTTIAYDGKTLAADKQITTGDGAMSTITKLRLVNGDRIAITGDASLAVMLLDWYGKGANPRTFPPTLLKAEGQASLWAVKPDGVVMKWETHPEPIILEDKIFTGGTGGDFARGAMAMGAKAVQAVLIASELDAFTGRGVDALDEGANEIRRAG